MAGSRKSKKIDIPLPTIVVDTREQKPYKFNKSTKLAGSISNKLEHGDYQIQGKPYLISVERKQNIDELAFNLSTQRERFEREMERMQEAKHKYIIVEDYWSSIYRPRHSKMNANALFGSIISFMAKYDVHFIFAGTREQAHKITRELLIKTNYYDELAEAEKADNEPT